MAICYLGSVNSDLSGGDDFNKELARSLGAETTLSVPMAKGATETSYAWSTPDCPNNADWETGEIVVKVDVSTASADIYLSVNAVRVNAAGAAQESATATAEQSLASVAVYTFTIGSKDWTAGNATDRLRIDYIFRNNKGTATRSCAIDTYTANASITSDIICYCLLETQIGAVTAVDVTPSMSRDATLISVTISAVSDTDTNALIIREFFDTISAVSTNAFLLILGEKPLVTTIDSVSSTDINTTLSYAFFDDISAVSTNNFALNQTVSLSVVVDTVTTTTPDLTAIISTSTQISAITAFASAIMLGAYQYNLERAVADGDFSLLTTLDYTEATYQDNGPFTDSVTYHYRIRKYYLERGGCCLCGSAGYYFNHD